MHELLKLLEKNARFKTRDLADLLAKKEVEIEGDIKDLENKGIIVGYHTIINWEASDTEICKAIIFVNCIPERDMGYDQIASRIARYPAVETL